MNHFNYTLDESELSESEQIEMKKGELLLEIRDTVDKLYKNSSSFDAIVSMAEYEEQDLNSIQVANLLDILTRGLDANIRKIETLFSQYDKIIYDAQPLYRIENKKAMIVDGKIGTQFNISRRQSNGDYILIADNFIETGKKELLSDEACLRYSIHNLPN